MAYTVKYETFNSLGGIFIDRKVFRSLIFKEIEDIVGLKKASVSIGDLRDQIKVEFEGNNVVVNVGLKVKYGLVIKSIVDEMIEKVRKMFEAIIGVKEFEINVYVKDLYFE